MSYHLANIGPYVIQERLGRGGMGAVFRAVHRDTGAPAAVKTVEVPRAGHLASIRREIRALQRVRHPGVVRILDEGVERGVPWYAMELIDGVSLRGYCARLADGVATVAGPTRPELDDGTATEELDHDGELVPAAGGALDQVLRIARRLCAPLAFVHGEGLVHRDLKPDNVFVRADGTPVLVDFGVATAFDGSLGRESLRVDSAFAGTIAYMAPEQLRGEYVDARADLYALGCILYELVTGAVPFRADSPSAVARAHLEQPPPPPSSRAEGVPGALDELILHLLAKLPEQRIGYAADVAAALGALIGDDDEVLWGGAPRSYLYRPRFAGRDAVVAELDRELVELDGGRGGVTLIGGESGAGKTRFALELARRCELRGARVVVGDCLPVGARGAGLPLHPLRRALETLADTCRERGRAETDLVFGARGKVLARYYPELAALPGQHDYPEPGELPVAEARARVFRALTRVFAAVGASAPTLLVLDDLQWADELTIGWLESLCELAPEAVPILVVATYRSEETDARLRALLEARGVRRATLGALGDAAVKQMVGGMLALDEPPPALIRFLARRTGGNPFFVCEYLRAAVAEGLMARDDGGRWRLTEGTRDDAYERLPLPDSVHALVRRRLDRLTPRARRIARVAAVLGRELTGELLAATAGVTEDELIGVIEELAARHVVLEVRPWRFRFAHDQLREVAYAGLDDGERAALHRAAAEALEGGDDRAALGYHWERAGVPHRARDCYLRGARAAAAAYAHGAAEELYRAALRLFDGPTPEQVAARIELGRQVLSLSGRNAEALAELALARDDARRLGDGGAEGRALTGVANVQRVLGKMAEARDSCERALALLGAAGDTAAQGAAMTTLGSTHWELGNLEGARQCYTEALALHREAGDRRAEAEVLSNLGSIHWDQARPAQARDCYDRALALHRALGNRRWEGVTLSNLACVHWGEGEVAQAVEVAERALELHRAVGDRRFESVTLAVLAGVRLDEGRPDEARALCDRALAVHREVGNRLDEGWTLIVLAGLERRAAGDLDACARVLERARAICDEAGGSLDLACWHCERGHLQLARGGDGAADLARARELAAVGHMSETSEVGRAIERLARAVEGKRGGRLLFRGEAVDALPAGLRGWYVRERLLATSRG